MEVNEDSEGRSFIKADFNLKDIRQVYNAINFKEYYYPRRLGNNE